MTGQNIVKVGPTDGQSIMAGYENFGPVLTESEMTNGQLIFVRMLQEKAVSENQQQLAGMALSYLRGEMDDASEEVKKMAKMGEKKLRDFAKTKHEGLPEKVEEAKCDSSDKNEDGEDERGEYAKKNLIKNRIRAALGIKNPIVISTSDETEGKKKMTSEDYMLQTKKGRVRMPGDPPKAKKEPGGYDYTPTKKEKENMKKTPKTKIGSRFD